jgi:hypothetical protein
MIPSQLREGVIFLVLFLAFGAACQAVVNWLEGPPSAYCAEHECNAGQDRER